MNRRSPFKLSAMCTKVKKRAHRFGNCCKEHGHRWKLTLVWRSSVHHIHAEPFIRSPPIYSTGRMNSYANPSSDIDQHPRTIPITSPESPSASTTASSDNISTAPSGLSSEIYGESISSRQLGLPVESTNTRMSQSTKQGPFTQHKRFFFEDGNITFLVRSVYPNAMLH